MKCCRWGRWTCTGWLQVWGGNDAKAMLGRAPGTGCRTVRPLRLMASSPTSIQPRRRSATSINKTRRALEFSCSRALGHRLTPSGIAQGLSRARGAMRPSTPARARVDLAQAVQRGWPRRGPAGGGAGREHAPRTWAAASLRSVGHVVVWTDGLRGTRCPSVAMRCMRWSSSTLWRAYDLAVGERCAKLPKIRPALAHPKGDDHEPMQVEGWGPA